MAKNGTLYVIGENPSLKVDGTNWTFNGGSKADTYSYSVAYSPEIKVVNSALEKVKIDGTGIDVSTSADLTGDWLESGKVHWDAATNTLTLNNATLVSKNNPLNFDLYSQFSEINNFRGAIYSRVSFFQYS